MAQFTKTAPPKISAFVDEQKGTVHRTAPARGLLLSKTGLKDAGCNDFSKAGDLGYQEAFDAIKQYCQ